MTYHIKHLNLDPDLRGLLEGFAADIADLASQVNSLAGQTGGAVTLATCVTSATAIAADLAAFATRHNATGTALNTSAGVTDTDYATDLAATAVAPTATTVAALVVTLTAAVADLGTFATAFNAMSTKLNADVLVTDTDYATNLAIDAAAVPATSDIAGITASAVTLVADLGAFRTAFNTRQTKIAADCAGTYTALAAVTAAAPAPGTPVDSLSSLRTSVT